MANTDRPNGFSFAKSLTGHAPNAMLRKIQVADRTSDTTNNHGDIYIGDPVSLSSGLAVVADSGDTVYGVVVGSGSGPSAVQMGEAGMFNADNLEQRYVPLTVTDGYVWVMPAEGNLFEIQTASDLDLVIGSTADMTTAADTAHGSRTTSQSNVELTTSSNADVRVVENVTTPNNDTTTANARHLVMFTTITNVYA